MLTITPLNSASSAVSYYSNDRSYYVNGDPGDRWTGEGAKELSLEGKKVKNRDFERILSGEVPGEDITLGRMRDGKKEHRAGLDLTFSAPKSVSLAALALNDISVIEVHRIAVERTLDYMEKHILETRAYNRELGKMVRVSSPTMIAATFQHEASRNQDPQLHTHCVIANMTKREDGKWMSIESASLSRHEKFLGAFYRNELARGLHDLGYELQGRDIGEMPGFEIKGFEKETLDKFSTRREEILNYIEERGWNYNAKSAQIAALATRPDKVEISQAKFRSMCRAEAKELGLESPLQKTVEGTPEQTDIAEQGLEVDIHGAINQAVTHLERHTPVFSLLPVKARVLAQLAGQVTLEQIEAGIAQMEAEGHLVKGIRRYTYQPYVSAETLKSERGMVEYMQAGQGKAEALVPEFKSNSLNGRGLTQDQTGTIKTILTSSDKVVGVQGSAGAGKTTMLKTMVEMAPDEHKFIGLAPTSSATAELGSEAGVPTRTLQYFLTKYGGDELLMEERRGIFKDSTLVLDEASMVSTNEMKAVFEITDHLGFDRVVLVGDKRQLRAIGAGQPFRQLQDHGMNTAEMNEIVRQKDKALLDVVEATRDGNLTYAIEELLNPENANSRLIEVENGELCKAAAEMWLAHDPEERKDTFLIAQTHDQRREIHQIIREGLEVEGHLSGEEFTGERLINRKMSNDQKRESFNYEIGDVLVFHQNAAFNLMKAEEHYTVTGIGEDGKVHLEDADGTERYVEPEKKGDRNIYRYEVYETTEIDLQAGDLISFTRNNKELGINNGDRATIESIDDQSVSIKMAGGDDNDQILELSLNHDAMKHIDHGYAFTTHKAQGKTTDRVIAVLDSGIGSLVSNGDLYVQLSRAEWEAVILTDNIVDLTEALDKDHHNIHLSALEAVGGASHWHDKEREKEHNGLEAKDIVTSDKFAKLFGFDTDIKSITKDSDPTKESVSTDDKSIKPTKDEPTIPETSPTTEEPTPLHETVDQALSTENDESKQPEDNSPGSKDTPNEEEKKPEEPSKWDIDIGDDFGP
jgi:conjugative relaxase-like TrwC/TraI family protein